MARLGEHYELGDIVAVQWNNELAQRFPDTDHRTCLQSMRLNSLGKLAPFDPPLCHGWHCPNCGQPCGSMGHRTCDRQR